MRQLPVHPTCRVILDNDWAGDPDGLVALAHHLLSPANRVVLVTSSFLDPRFDSPRAAARHGAESARRLLDLVGGFDDVPVHPGHDGPETDRRPLSPAARCIVEEAQRDDDLPLMLVCGGPLTNVAEALAAEPAVASRLTLIWVGGSLDPDAEEYNRDTDPSAAEAVLGQPGLRILQFPLETYRRCAFSVAELEHDLGGSGRVGAWLWQQFLELPLPDFVRLGGVWPLGDSPPVLLTALDDASSSFEMYGDRRVFTDVDMRLLVGDLLAKLRLHEHGAAG